MKKLILLIFSIITLNATETVNYYGDIVNIKLSQDSWNRLIFDSEINAEPIFSKEKNVDIYRANNSVFIKFKPMVKVEVLDKQEQILDIDYTNAKTDTDANTSAFKGEHNLNTDTLETEVKISAIPYNYLIVHFYNCILLFHCCFEQLLL